MEIVKRSMKDKLFKKKKKNKKIILQLNKINKLKNNNKTDLGIDSAHEELTGLDLSSHFN